MTKAAFILICFAAALSGTGLGQSGPPAPRPIIETELKENGTQIRAIEMERIKRETRKPKPDEEKRARELRFQETKKRFENIQKLQEKIVRTFTTGRTIDYARIRSFSEEISQDAGWLEKELFGAAPNEPGSGRSEESMPPGVRELIILLDNAIGNFVSSKFFERGAVVDKKMFQEAHDRLGRVLLLSRRLASAAAERN
jgi:hypothetical protein